MPRRRARKSTALFDIRRGREINKSRESTAGGDLLPRDDCKCIPANGNVKNLADSDAQVSDYLALTATIDVEYSNVS